MNKQLFASVVCASLALTPLCFAHGGTYRGPVDVTPPSGGGGSGGAVPTPGPALPGTPQPGGGRSTPGAGTPGQPAGGPNRPAGPESGGADRAADLSAWQVWWGFNKERYLNLRSHINSIGQITGSSEYYLGQGERVQAKDTLRVSEATIRQVIVPRLLKALQQESSNDIQSSCMIALAKIGDSKTEAGAPLTADVQREIEQRLTSSSQELRETAAVALGIMAERGNIPLLCALLENDDQRLRALGVLQDGNVSVRTRAFAAYGLGLIGCKSSPEDRLLINATLQACLAKEGSNVAQRDIAVACLTSIGLSPLEIGFEGDSTGESAKRGQPKKLSSRQDQLRFLLSYFGDESKSYLVRAHAPTAMARLLDIGDLPAEFGLRDELAASMMQSLSKDSKAQDALQQSCALALGVIGDSDEDPTDMAIRAALMRVKDELADQQVRNFALIALAQAAGRPGHGAGDPIHGVNSEDKRENARSFLLRELGRGRDGVRTWSALAIAVLERTLDDARQASSSEAKMALRATLEESRSPQEIGAFAIASGLVKDLGAKDVLLANLITLRDNEARGYTAIGLGLMNETSAIAPIQTIVKKSKYQPDMLKSAAIGLGLLGDKQLVPDLIEMLSNANGLSSQAAISSALGFIGDARSVDALIGLLENQEVTDMARAFAAVSLGIIADKEDLPWNSKIGANSNYRANTESLTDQRGGILDIL